MSRTVGLREITRFVSDGTGRTPEQLWFAVAAAASLTALTVALRAVDAVLTLWPESSAGQHPR